MKRYVLSPVVQRDGAIGTFWTVKVADYTRNVVALIPADPATGAPTSAWALCRAAATDWRAILTDSELDVLPDYHLDGDYRSLSQSARAAFQSMLQRRGLTLDRIQTNDGWRHAIRSLGRTLDPAFHEDSFDVAE